MTEKKRQKEEKEFLHRLRPFARLQTADDYDAFTTDMLCKWTAIPLLALSHQWSSVLSLDEALLRKRIQELQQYRRFGLSTSADIEKYDLDLAKRVCSPILLSIPLFFTFIAVQTQKVAPARDFTSDRLQYRAGGRHSSGPDPRRASLTSFAGESEDKKSRESTPRLGPTPGPSTGPPVRRRRKYYFWFG
jgi:transcriptional adapter 2-alpha